MFLTNKPATLQDFLTSLSFIAPRGMSPDYFVAPEQKAIPQEVEAATEPSPTKDDNIRYFKKSLSDTHSFNELSTPSAALIPKPFPKRPIGNEQLDNRFYNTGYIKSPEIRRDSQTGIPATAIRTLPESADFILTENCFLPKNTVIHFSKRG